MTNSTQQYIERQHQRWQMYRRRPSRFAAKAGIVNLELRFNWFDEVGDEDNPNSIVLRITLTEGTITDNERKYGEQQYEIDFINKTAK